jgi:hypothetical protein
MTNVKEILRQFGESTAYSAKCHFKAADLRRLTIFWWLFVNISLSIVTLTDLLPNLALKILSVLALIGSVVLIMYDTKNGISVCPLHMKFGNEYLTLHNDIYFQFKLDNDVINDIEKLKERMNDLNKQEKPEIPLLAKNWATRAIEKKHEMTKWW